MPGSNFDRDTGYAHSSLLWFSSVSPAEYRDLSHNRFLPHPCLFIIRGPSSPSVQSKSHGTHTDRLQVREVKGDGAVRQSFVTVSQKSNR